MSVRSVADLHRQWKVGTSVLSVIKTPRGFGLVAVAVVARTLLIAVGPLLQRTVDFTQHPPVSLKVTLPSHLPRGWAGTSDLRTTAPSELFEEAYHGYASQEPLSVNLEGCKGQCQLSATAPGLWVQDSDCVSTHTAVDRFQIKYWPRDSHDKYILFSAGFSTEFTDRPQWFGPEAMKSEISLPEPPKDQESVAIYYTAVNYTDRGGLMYYKQCWIRSAVVLHEMRVEANGGIIGDYNTTLEAINNDAEADSLYRQGKNNNMSIGLVAKRLSSDLVSSVYFESDTDGYSTSFDAGRGSLGTSNIITNDLEGNFEFRDPMSSIVRILNDVYFRAAAISGFQQLAEANGFYSKLSKGTIPIQSSGHIVYLMPHSIPTLTSIALFFKLQATQCLGVQHETHKSCSLLVS